MMRQQPKSVHQFGMAGFVSFIILLLASLGVAATALAGPIAYNRPGIFPLPWGSYDVWLINPDGSENHRIPVPDDLLSAQQPEWSRDNQSIAATGFVCRGPDCFESPVVFDPTGNRVLLIDSVGGAFDVQLIFKAFSPDRTRLAFVIRYLNNAIFGTINLTGPTKPFLPRVDRLVDPEIVILGSRDDPFDGGASGVGIDWSPTQDLLVTSLCYPSPPREICSLFLVQPVSGGLGNPIPLTFPVPDVDTFQIFESRPTFSPDGSRVAFVRRTDRAFGPSTTALWVTDGVTEQRVVEFVFQADMPVSWSPDSTTLIFGASTFAENFGLWTINVDSTNLQRFLAPPAQEPSWSAGP
jgi:WD40 repeat protein